MESSSQATLAANLQQIRGKQGGARLIAVSKGQPAAAVDALYGLGQRCFGENRVQEAAEKFADFRGKWPDLDLHLIGLLQRNKVKQALALFDMIQSVDRPELVIALAAHLKAAPRPVRFMVQVNIGREPQKAGVLPEKLDDLLMLCREQELPVCGLMCIPPAAQDPQPYFRQLAQMARSRGLAELSMGMSGDYAEAVAAGATYIRVGTALFGSRA